MTRSDLIEQLSRQYPLLGKDQVTVIFKKMMDTMKEALKRGDKVEIRGFGSFHLRCRKKREGRNPKTGAPVSIPEKKVPFFKAGKELRKRVDH